MNLRIFIYSLICLLGFSLISRGQDIKLNDVTRIEFSTRGSFTGPFLRITEIIPEGGGWKCYQLAHYENLPKPVRDSIRHFVKTVSVNDLAQLVKYINSPDTVLNLKRFHISKKELNQAIDSLQASGRRGLALEMKYHYSAFHKDDSITANLTAQQKILFKKAINSKQTLKNASLKMLNPLALDDRYYYAIIFTYNNNHKDTIFSYENPSNIYHLPWRIKGKNSYDPRLTDLFELMNNNEKAIKEHKDVLNYMIDREIFDRTIAPQAYWEYYIRHSPLNYASLSKTLVPADIYANGKSGHVKSSLLPANVLISFGFADDTLATFYLNKEEKSLAGVYEKGNFLFEYFKEHPDDAVFASISISKAKVVDQIKAIYPDIIKYDPLQIQALNVLGDYHRNGDLRNVKSSFWLSLPDGKVILLRFNDKLITRKDKIFANFKPNAKGHNTCIVFDKDGKRIAGDESDVIIKTH